MTSVVPAKLKMLTWPPAPTGTMTMFGTVGAGDEVDVRGGRTGRAGRVHREVRTVRGARGRDVQGHGGDAGGGHAATTDDGDALLTGVLERTRGVEGVVDGGKAAAGLEQTGRVHTGDRCRRRGEPGEDVDDQVRAPGEVVQADLARSTDRDDHHVRHGLTGRHVDVRGGGAGGACGNTVTNDPAVGSVTVTFNATAPTPLAGTPPRFSTVRFVVLLAPTAPVPAN